MIFFREIVSDMNWKMFSILVELAWNDLIIISIFKSHQL